MNLNDENTLRLLVSNAVRNAGRLARGTGPRWAHVANTFAVGSTTAYQLCREFAVDPTTEVGSDE